MTEQYNDKLGTIWCDIFKSINLSKDGKVLEFASGSVPKIGLGLAKYGFKGTVHVLEPERQSLIDVTKAYRELLPNALIIGQSIKINDMEYNYFNNMDAIVSNHPLDDMIIGEYLEKEEFQNFFNDHYNSSIEYTDEAWSRMIKENKLVSCLNSVVNQCCSLIHFNPKHLIISQYKSYFFESYNLPTPDLFAKCALQDIKKKITEKTNMNNINISNDLIDDPTRWLLLRKE